ncbi:histidine kinase dimerization/phospho-acceptor domain-containing protein [uncultured Thiodictyon sp.]|jgi:signal transduction histidine kinase|uniref:histidine kinase dimerization/phospho-acceptor domain-containing protein n=1 Tax=uncultured Thiodictyon sp. TaxID=1846217 RepID=UPI0025CF6DFB|nr:histidine kinase dimerization/phospho-acceptor domain-containing protein [uncultured Thiodictyon sp.]
MLALSPLLDDQARWGDLYREAQGFRESFGSHVILADVGDPMRMLFSTRLPFGTPLPPLPRPQGHAAAPAAVATGKPAVGDSFIGPVVKEPLVAIAVPVLRDGKPAFVLLTTIETRQFQTRLDQFVLPDGWAVSLRDSRGEVIARRAPPGFDAAREVDSAGRFQSRSAASPWSVTVEIPRAVQRASLLAAVTALGLGLLGATLAGVFGGLAASRRLGRAVAMLTRDPAAEDARAPAIAEIAAARDLLAATSADLRESAARFRRLFDSAPVPMGLADEDGLLATFVDVTEQRQTQARLRLWAETFDQAQVGLAIADARSNTFVAVNPAFARERKRAEQALIEAHAAALQQQQRARLALLNQMQDALAARAQAEEALAALRESEARIRMLNSDLERRVAARTAEATEARLRADQANAAKSAFLANMSHEIRTPMNAIIGLTHLLRQSVLTHGQRDHLTKINAAGYHLLSIINDILDLSKIEASRMQLEETDFALQEVLAHVDSLIAEAAQAKGLTIEIDTDAVPLWLRGDPTRVRQALLNFAGNAAKFTEQGRIALRACCRCSSNIMPTIRGVCVS